MRLIQLRREDREERREKREERREKREERREERGEEKKRNKNESRKEKREEKNNTFNPAKIEIVVMVQSSKSLVCSERPLMIQVRGRQGEKERRKK